MTTKQSAKKIHLSKVKKPPMRSVVAPDHSDPLALEIQRIDALANIGKKRAVVARAIALKSRSVLQRLRSAILDGWTLAGSAVALNDPSVSERIVVTFFLLPKPHVNWLLGRSFAALVDTRLSKVISIADIDEDCDTPDPFVVAISSGAEKAITSVDDRAEAHKREFKFLGDRNLNLRKSPETGTTYSTTIFGGPKGQPNGTKEDLKLDV